MSTNKPEYVDENAAIVQNIILWRIYDIMLVLLQTVHPDAARQIALVHENGGFIGPNPSIAQETEDGPDDEEPLPGPVD